MMNLIKGNCKIKLKFKVIASNKIIMKILSAIRLLNKI